MTKMAVAHIDAIESFITDLHEFEFRICLLTETHLRWESFTIVGQRAQSWMLQVRSLSPNQR